MQPTHSSTAIPSKPSRLAKGSRRKAPPPQGVLIVSMWPLRLVGLGAAKPRKRRSSAKKSATA